MNAIVKGCKDGVPKCEDEKNMRICMCHFHPSVVCQNSSGKCMLKNGVSPTTRMTKFSKENGKHAEESSLPRIAGKVEDLQCMRNCEQKLKMPPNSNASQIVTPSRENRANKRNFDVEDLQCMCNHEQKLKIPPNSNASQTVTPSRENRANKRNFDVFQIEEKRQLAEIEKNRITSMSNLSQSVNKH